MKPELIETLKKLAARNRWGDDPEFNIYDYGGGNYDDCYYGGHEDGEAAVARDVLDAMGVEWKLTNQAAKNS